MSNLKSINVAGRVQPMLRPGPLPPCMFHRPQHAAGGFLSVSVRRDVRATVATESSSRKVSSSQDDCNATKIAAELLGTADRKKLEELEAEAFRLARGTMSSIHADKELDALLHGSVHSAFSAAAHAAAAADLPHVGCSRPVVFALLVDQAPEAKANSSTPASKDASDVASELLGSPDRKKLEELEAEAFRLARGAMSSVQGAHTDDGKGGSVRSAFAAATAAASVAGTVAKQY